MEKVPVNEYDMKDHAQCQRIVNANHISTLLPLQYANRARYCPGGVTAPNKPPRPQTSPEHHGASEAAESPSGSIWGVARI